MKKRNLFVATLAVMLAGCGGGGGSDSNRDARAEVDDFLGNLESAYANGSRSRFANLISLNYCQDGRDYDAEVEQFQLDIDDAAASGASDAYFTDVNVRNARFVDGQNRVQADVTYKVVFTDSSGDEVGFLPTFDYTLILRREGSVYKDYGDGSCNLTRSGSSAQKGHRIVIVKAKPAKGR